LVGGTDSSQKENIFKMLTGKIVEVNEEILIKLESIP